MVEGFAIEPDLIRPITRSEYDQMIALGLFQDERVELLRGTLVKLSPQLAPHASTIRKLTRLLMEQLQARFELSIQSLLALSDDSEPEPDVAVVPLGSYDTEHPRTALLVIEVSDSTLRKDRSKAALYASAGIGEYWLVNLNARAVEIYSSHDGDRYVRRPRGVRARDAASFARAAAAGRSRTRLQGGLLVIGHSTMSSPGRVRYPRPQHAPARSAVHTQEVLATIGICLPFTLERAIRSGSLRSKLNPLLANTAARVLSTA